MLPTEYMTTANQKKIIPMVIGKISITLKGKKGRKNKIKNKLFNALFDSGTTANLIADHLVTKKNKNKINKITFTTANG